MEKGWFVIALSKEVSAKKPVKLRRFGQDWVLWRDQQGKTQMIEDRCPHRGASLSLGTIQKGCVVCPFHAFSFSGEGTCTQMPVLPKGNIPRQLSNKCLPVKEAHSFIWAWPATHAEPEGEPLWFDELKSGWKSSSFCQEWKAHYTRAIENQLDVFHVAIVHKKTIGSLAAIQSIPSIENTDSQLDVSIDMVEKGAKLSKALCFLMPNVWLNRIAPVFMISAAFAPIDDEHTALYLTTHQKFLPVPWLGEFMAFCLNGFNRLVLREDRVVVESQKPLIAGPQDEILVQPDAPVAVYRRMRRKRLREEA